jgi:hypothetical protein
MVFFFLPLLKIETVPNLRLLSTKMKMKNGDDIGTQRLCIP